MSGLLRNSDRIKLPRLVCSILFSFLVAALGHATIGTEWQMLLGNPSNATADAGNHTHYLIQRAQYALDYNDTTHEPNWVSWNLTADDVGESGRSSSFYVDTTLPTGFYRVRTTDYSGSGYDRGHMCPSADRSATQADNTVTFYMSNMAPQTPDNNQGVWANFESYCRTLAAAGNEVLITCGTSGFTGATLASGVAIPESTWKIVIVVPLGPGPAVDRILATGAATIRVITVKIPNVAGIRGTPWQNFVTSPAQIQADTGYEFFTALPGEFAAALRSKIDGQVVVGAPNVTIHPAPQTIARDGTASFFVSATGNAPLSYQWMHDDAPLSGATSPTLVLANVRPNDAGLYYVEVSNNAGSTTSNSAALTVITPPSDATISITIQSQSQNLFPR